MNPQKLFAREWASYRERVLHVDAGPVQVSETQMAFYGGAAALFSLIERRLSPGTEPTDADVEFMEALASELRGFTP